MRLDTTLFDPRDQRRRPQHAGPWTWLEVRLVASGSLRTVFLPLCQYDSFASICDAWGRTRANSINQGRSDPDDFDEEGRAVMVTSVDWPMSISLVCSPEEAETFFENLSALPERSAA